MKLRERNVAHARHEIARVVESLRTEGTGKAHILAGLAAIASETAARCTDERMGASTCGGPIGDDHRVVAAEAAARILAYLTDPERFQHAAPMLPRLARHVAHAMGERP